MEFVWAAVGDGFVTDVRHWRVLVAKTVVFLVKARDSVPVRSTVNAVNWIEKLWDD